MFSGSNIYSGSTTIAAGALQAVDGVGLPAVSNLVFSGSLAQTNVGAVFQSSGTFSRSLGVNGDQVQWTVTAALRPAAASCGEHESERSAPMGCYPVLRRQRQRLDLRLPHGQQPSELHRQHRLDRRQPSDLRSPRDRRRHRPDLRRHRRQWPRGQPAENRPGHVDPSGSNSYDGGTTVADGTLMVATASALPAGGSLAVGADGTFIFDPTAAAAPLAASPAGSVAPVPEPGTLALLLAGAMLAAFAAWRQRKN